VAYPQRLLADGERLEFQTRPHWRALVVPVVRLLLVLAVAGFAWGWTSGRSWTTPAHGAVAVVAVLAVAAWFVRDVVTWRSTEYVFTSRRIITRSGVLAREGRDMPYTKVNDVAFRYSVLERLLGCGTLTVSSAADNGDLVIGNVPRVEELQRDIYRLVDADAQRRAGPLQPPDTW